MASSRLFVRGLPPVITEADFRKHFSQTNQEITDVKVIPQRRIGYVGYKTPEDAVKAAKYFNKSYIRMSKLFVEMAKPISDASLNRGNQLNGVYQSVAPGDEKSQTQDDLSKKRKRDEGSDQTNPKLQEFLRVMKSGGKEDAMEDPNHVDASSGWPKPGAEAPNEESDDEYEQIPKHTEKHRRTETSAPPQARPTVELHMAKVKSRTMEIDEEGQAKPGRDTAVQVATDDDWLRSRTSRTLDFVDPEDIATSATAHSVVQPEEERKEGSVDETSNGPMTLEDPTARHPQTDGKEQESSEEVIRRTSRLFVRNLAYHASEKEIHDEFSKFGELLEVHICVDKAGGSKGFAFIHYADPLCAVTAFQSMDGVTFQGRILHIIPSTKKKDEGLNEFEISKLPLKQQQKIRKKAEAASKTFNWNSLYMSQDAVNASVASRLGVTKSELLDPTSADAAVKQAIAETTVIQETKSYFAANGVDLDAFKSQKRGHQSILVKNFPHGTTIAELRALFEAEGPVSRVLMPPGGTIAIVQFSQEGHAKTAFRKLAYSRMKERLLFLEKAPRDLFKGEPPLAEEPSWKETPPARQQKIGVDELLSREDGVDDELETTSLFVRNLNFITTTSRLAEAFQSLDGFVSARVKTKTDPKKPGQILSMGFGFVEFRSKGQAQAALKAMDGFVVDDHTLAVKASHKGLDAAEERRREDKAKKAAGQRTKILIKNLPFQATKKDVRALFGTYGQLRSVRVPKKADYTTRGFAFADFITPREAESALKALRNTHLLGRKLVLDYAEAEAVDAEEEIEKMQRKVGGQANKVALQQLTGGGRKKINIRDDNEDEFESGK